MEVNTGLALVLVSLWTMGSRLFRDIDEEVLLFEAAAAALLTAAAKVLLLVALLLTSRTYMLAAAAAADDDGTLAVDTTGVALVSLQKKIG